MVKGQRTAQIVEQITLSQSNALTEREEKEEEENRIHNYFWRVQKPQTPKTLTFTQPAVYAPLQREMERGGIYFHRKFHFNNS